MRRLLLFFCFLVSAFAVDWKTYKAQGYVSDFAGVVDPQSRAELESYSARIRETTGAQFAFVTIPSLEGEPIEDVANNIFHNWGIGEKGKDNGLMVLLSVGDRKSRLEVGGGLGESVPDSMAGLLLEDMRPALRQSEYGTAMLLAAKRLGSTLTQPRGVRLAAPSIPHKVEPTMVDSVPWPAILVGVFFLFLFFLVVRRGHRGVRTGGGFGAFDSGGATGGFGGFDSGSSSLSSSGSGVSGDSGGGFGGGDSGGGGASSDW